MKQRYSSVLSQKYSEKEIKIVSTEYDRTIESALSNLAGMYPPIEEEIFLQNMPWQPIPVRSTPAEYDTLLGFSFDCPAYSDALEEVMASQKVTDAIENGKPLFDYMTLHSGQNVTNLMEAMLIRDNLYINKLYNRL